MATGIVPDILKLAKVIPLYKAKDRQLLTNYRPISLLPSLSKVLEKAVHHKLMRFLNNNGLLYESQYGFRKHHNTIHGVTELVHNIIHGYEKGEMTIGVTADLSKAFDTIDHDILLNKLGYYGIRGIAQTGFVATWETISNTWSLMTVSHTVKIWAVVFHRAQYWVHYYS